MIERQSFAYVVAVEGSKVTLNLKDSHRGPLSAHGDGVSAVTDIGALIGVKSGPLLLVLRVWALRFVEPKVAHNQGVGSSAPEGSPLRNIESVVVGYVLREGARLRFEPDSLQSPPLGADAFPLSDDEWEATRDPGGTGGPRISLGTDVRSGQSVEVGVSDALGRHVAVLGSTGQGKSCFTAAALQQLVKLPYPRIVVFDINGEYGPALKPHVKSGKELKVTILGGLNPDFKIPYYAFGRHGLGRLLLPSEKTQRPALNFALDALPFVEWHDATGGVGLVGQGNAVLFDDCRAEGAGEALEALTVLRGDRSTLARATKWPPMEALGCLVAESHSTRMGNRMQPERNSFEYGNISGLVTRIRRRAQDELFRQVVNVNGGKPAGGTALDWQKEGERIVETIFGSATKPTEWKAHILDLRGVAHDLMPLVLGGVLELLAFELFRRGPEKTYPTLVVLEEAHHYLRPIGDADDDPRGSLAYERLAKEGRKFGVGILLSTQRPSELSSTVLSQCGTWVVFRLTGESDRNTVAAAAEWADRFEIERIGGLPRRHAIAFGSGLPMATHIVAREANPTPVSKDPDFSRWAPNPLTPLVRKRNCAQGRPKSGS